MVGQVDCLEMREDINHWKYSKLDLSPVLYKEPASDIYRFIQYRRTGSWIGECT